MATATAPTAATSGGVLFTPLGVRLPAQYVPGYPEPPQEAFLALDCLEAFYGGAAGPGKSWALLVAAAQYVDVPGYSALILRRTYPELSMPGGLMHRSKLWWSATDAKWSGAGGDEPYTWRFPSGARIVFGHAETETAILRYYGSEWQFVGWDELTAFPESFYRLLFSRLRKPDHGPLSGVPLRMRGASNPGGRGHEWVKRRFVDRLPDPQDAQDTPELAARRIFIRARLEDNPHVDQATYRLSLASLEPEVRAQLLEGDWDARQPGDWYFDDRHLSAVAEQGRRLEAVLQAGELEPYGGVVHLGIDTGDNWHSVLGVPMERGGVFVAREYVSAVGEAIEATHGTLDLNAFGWPWGRVNFDAAGKVAMATFTRESGRLLGFGAPRKFPVAFGKYKGMAALHMRRLARRAHGAYVKDRLEVVEGTPGATFLPGPLPGHLAISPHCPVLLRQMKVLQRNPESRQGEWLKDDDQHGPDAVVALVAKPARDFRAPAPEPVAA